MEIRTWLLSIDVDTFICRISSVISKMGFIFLEQGFNQMLVPICIGISVALSGVGFYYQVLSNSLINVTVPFVDGSASEFFDPNRGFLHANVPVLFSCFPLICFTLSILCNCEQLNQFIETTGCLSKILRWHNMAHSILTDSWSEAWESYCGIYLLCCCINCNWCSCWHACFRWTIAFSANSSCFASAWMVYKYCTNFIVNMLTEESFGLIFGPAAMGS